MGSMSESPSNGAQYNMVPTNNTFIIDYGATKHMTCDSRQVQTLKPSPKTIVSVANGNVAPIIRKGNVSLSNILNLDFVLVVHFLD